MVEGRVNTTLQNTLLETNSESCIPLLSPTTIDPWAPCCHETDEGLHPPVIGLHNQPPDDLLLGAAMGAPPPIYQQPMEEVRLLVNPTQPPHFSCETQAVDLPVSASHPFIASKQNFLISSVWPMCTTRLISPRCSSPLDAAAMVNMRSLMAGCFVHTRNLVAHVSTPTPKYFCLHVLLP